MPAINAVMCVLIVFYARNRVGTGKEYETMHCPVCGQPTQWVWRLSPVRLFLAIVTCGFWLWVAPPFELRCKACGVSREKAARKLMIMSGIVTHVDPR